MVKGLSSLIYPVTDLEKSKKLYTKLLGVKPNYADEYYVGFQVGGDETDYTYQEIGLIRSDKSGQPAINLRVEDIEKSLREFIEAGATLHEDIHNIDNDMRMASVADLDGNVIGLLQFTPEKKTAT